MSLIFRIWKHIRQSWLAKISTILTLIAFGVGALNVDFLIPQNGYWIIAVLSLALVFFDVLKELHSENMALSNPNVDFEIQIEPPTGIKGHSELFDLDLLEIGVLELYSKLTVRNTRPQPTIIEFEIIHIESDLPTEKQAYNLEVYLSRQTTQKSNILEIGLSKWEKDVRIEFNLDLKLSPVAEKLKLIGKATFLNITVRATQSDGGFTDFVVDFSEVCNWVREKIIERSIQRIQDTHAGRQPSLNPRDFVNYARLVWKEE